MDTLDITMAVFHSDLFVLTECIHSGFYLFDIFERPAFRRVMLEKGVPLMGAVSRWKLDSTVLFFTTADLTGSDARTSIRNWDDMDRISIGIYI